MGIKQQNADTAAALLSQKADALDVGTSKTLLDALNSSDKAKSGAAIKQLLMDSIPQDVAPYIGAFLDENKMNNDKVRKAITDKLTQKVGVQPPAKATEKPGAKQPAGGKLTWNGTDYPDTPANRAWIEKKNSKRK
jgi:hypothetical protein